MRWLFLGLLVLPGQAAAWEAMDVAALAGLEIRFGRGMQHFYPSGRTFHTPRADDPFADGPSWGYWKVVDARYCAQWPPDPGWMCFDLDRSGRTVRFQGDDGGVVLGEVVAGENE